jgi:hypothetical protein
MDYIGRYLLFATTILVNIRQAPCLKVAGFGHAGSEAEFKRLASMYGEDSFWARHLVMREREREDRSERRLLNSYGLSAIVSLRACVLFGH